MAYTLFDAITALAATLREVHTGKADSATLTSIVDSRFHGTSDFYHEGTLFEIAQRETREISSITAGAITFTPALTVTTTAGNRFMVLPPTYPLQEVVNAVNLALRAAGPMTLVNDDLDVVASTYDYDLATAGISNVVRVETTSDTAAPYEYKRNHYWQEVDGYLSFTHGKQPITAGAPIRVYYNDVHPWVSAMGDSISASIHPERLRWEALANLYRWRNSKTGKDEEGTTNNLNEAAQMAMHMANLYPVRRLNKDIHYAEW